MRIISGEHRGRRLLEFKGMDIRPTTDRVKESVFNLIQEYISGAEVLDMFGGSGALSLEALSRGAAHAVCIDKDRRAADIIRKNAQTLNYTDKCEILNGDSFEYLRRCGRSFDIVFLDPPYNEGFIEPALRGISENDILSEGGIAVLESDDTDFFGEADGLEIIKQRKYGRTYITVYRKKELTDGKNSNLSGKL